MFAAINGIPLFLAVIAAIIFGSWVLQTIGLDLKHMRRRPRRDRR